MFESSVTNDLESYLIQARLARILPAIKAMTLYTREDYIARITSLVNVAINNGTQMTPLKPVAPGPATVRDVVTSFTSINQDAADIAGLVLQVEDSAASVCNLAASSHQSIVQQLRKVIYSSSEGQYLEAFVDQNEIDNATANVDYAAGVVTLPVTANTKLKPVVSLGSNSVGVVGSSLANLTDGLVDTSFVFNGSVLQLNLTFATPTVANRIILQLDDYEGLEITSWTSTPDNLSSNDILAALDVDTIALGVTSGKYSGIPILDFPAQMVQQMSLVLRDVTGRDRIALRQLEVFCLTFASSGSVTSTKQSKLAFSSAGAVFAADAVTTSNLTVVTHQVSNDGVNFTTIVPGTTTAVADAYWYRALLQRNDSLFTASSPISNPLPGTSPNTNYTNASITSTPLGSGLTQWVISLGTVTGPITLNETPVTGSFSVSMGTSILTRGQDYAFTNNILSFPSDVSSITISYQVSADSVNLPQLKSYYSPYLYEISFTGNK